MKLSVRNFRVWEKKTIKVTSVPVTLLSGVSGSGKSTLLDAIAWCLYGKEPDVANDYNPTQRTIVTLSVGSSIIRRKTKPKELEVEHNDSYYSDLEAQAIIDSLYGTRQSWYYLSYCPQDRLNAIGNFYTASNTAKMEYLSLVTFPSDDLMPFVVISKVNSAISEVKKELLRLETDFEKAKGCVKDHSREVRKCDDKNYIAKVDRVQWKNKEEELSRLEKKTIVDSEHNRHVSLAKKTLTLKLSKLKEPIPPQNFDSFSGYSDSELLKWQKDYKTKQILLSDYKEEEFEDGIELLSMKEIFAVRKIEADYYNGIKVCEKLDVDYNTNSISERLSFYSDLATKIDQRNGLLAEKNKTERKLNLYPSVIPEIIPKPSLPDRQPLSALEGRLSDLEAEVRRSKLLYSCPSCSAPFIIVKDKPQVAESVAVDETELKEIRKKLVDEKAKWQLDSKNYNNLTVKYKQLKVDIEKWNETVPVLKSRLDSVNVKLSEIILPNYSHCWESDYKALKTVKVVEKPKFSSDILQSYAEWRKRKAQIEAITIPECISDSSIADVLAYRKDIISYSAEKEKLEKELSKLSIRSVANIAEISAEIKTIRNNLRISELVDYYRKDVKVLEKAEKKVTKYRGTLDILISIKKKAQRGEKAKLQSTVDAINKNLNSILPHFFGNNISVSIKLEKTLADGTKRRAVSVEISKPGLDKPTCYSKMSGGEKCRLRLSFLLSLYPLSKFPFILLDETISSLDLDLRQTCLSVMQKYLTQKDSNDCLKSVIVVCHDVAKGHYDSVIEL